MSQMESWEPHQAAEQTLCLLLAYEQEECHFFDLFQPPLPQLLSDVKGSLDLVPLFLLEKHLVPKPVWDPWGVYHDGNEGVQHAAAYQRDLTQSHLNQNALDSSSLKDACLEGSSP